MHALGGVQVSGVSDPTTCQNWCLNNSTCVAYDYDTGANACYWFSNAAIANVTGSSPGVNHYTKVTTCSGGGTGGTGGKHSTETSRKTVEGA